MAKSKDAKQLILDKLIAKIKTAKSIVFANYQGLKVIETEDLRKKCKQESIDFTAAKKTLLALAFKENGIEADLKKCEGSIGVAISQNDEVSPAKVLKEFAKTHDKVKFLGGVLEGKVISIDFIKQLADLPGRQELLSRLVGSINAPLSGLINVLAGNLRGLVNVLNAIKNSKTN